MFIPILYYLLLYGPAAYAPIIRKRIFKMFMFFFYSRTPIRNRRVLNIYYYSQYICRPSKRNTEVLSGDSNAVVFVI